ncbi:hypothetical protein [Streptomyces sp. bgisy032]|uniref:hypothetical protein n=1 Tax=Streptomyces sp. bgisy032 TaxID=3413773 RepID=UPI003D71151D
MPTSDQDARTPTPDQKSPGAQPLVPGEKRPAVSGPAPVEATRTEALRPVPGEERTVVLVPAPGREGAEVPPLASGEERTTVLVPAPGQDATVVLPPAPRQESAEPLAPAPGEERTAVLAPAPGRERTEVLTSAVPGEGPTDVPVPVPGEERTQALPPAPGEERTQALPPAPGAERTEVLAPAPRQEPTDPAESAGKGAARAHLGPTSDADGVEYSATVLGSHWIVRPGEDDTRVEESAGERRPVTAPDRTDGSVLRFGPGVTAAVAHRTHRTFPTAVAAPPPAPPRRRWRRHALPALVLLCVLAFLAWQRLGPPLAVRTAEVTARPEALGCGGTAHIVGVVTTNGRPGTLSYRWVRSDGTSSGVLEEVLVRGQRQARLHLRWTFQGTGHYTARAELRVLTASPRAVSTRFTYDCP